MLKNKLHIGCSSYFFAKFAFDKSFIHIKSSNLNYHNLKGYYAVTHTRGDEWTTHHRCWTHSPLITCVAITRSLVKAIQTVTAGDLKFL